MLKLAAVRVLLSCEDEAEAAAEIGRRLADLGPRLLACSAEGVGASERADRPGTAPAEEVAVQVEPRQGHLQLATRERVLIDFGAGPVGAQVDDARHIARCVNSHHHLLSALRDAMHHLTQTQAGEKTPHTSAELIELLAGALARARTPVAVERVADAPASAPRRAQFEAA